VKQDNLDPPIALSTPDQEFFAIDTYTFTIANATDLSGLTITATDSGPGKCSFQLYRATTDLLTDVTFVPPPEVTFPSYGASYIYNYWKFDNTTCDVASASCCCLTGTASVMKDLDGSQSFFISAPGSVGCNLPEGTTDEEDDFPWPTSGTLASSSVQVNGFLANQDNYLITLTQLSNGSFTLTFTDQVTPKCSMLAYRPGSGSGSELNWNWISMVIGLVALILAEKVSF